MGRHYRRRDVPVPTSKRREKNFQKVDEIKRKKGTCLSARGPEGEEKPNDNVHSGSPLTKKTTGQSGGQGGKKVRSGLSQKKNERKELVPAEKSYGPRREGEFRRQGMVDKKKSRERRARVPKESNSLHKGANLIRLRGEKHLTPFPTKTREQWGMKSVRARVGASLVGDPKGKANRTGEKKGEAFTEQEKKKSPKEKKTSGHKRRARCGTGPGRKGKKEFGGRHPECFDRKKRAISFSQREERRRGA